MVKLTVLLIRSAETEEERVGGRVRVTDETVNAELKRYISNQAQDETGQYDDGSRSLSARMDPALTKDRGFVQAQDCMTALLDAITAGQPKRKVALFSSPHKAAAMTAFMMSCADISHPGRECLTWRLTTFDGASAPAVIPVVMSDGLCNADPDVMAFGGSTAAVDAGIFHCAGRPFNDGRTKCPFMKVFKKIKECTQERIDDWDEARDEQGKKIHQINHVQYFRIADPDDPWSLAEMVPKINLLIDYIEPKKYLLTPRKGMFDPKKHFHEWKDGIAPAVKQTVWWAREAGCDTVIITVNDAALAAMCAEHGAGNQAGSSPPPCSMASFVAEVSDTARSPDSMKFSFYRFCPLGQLETKGKSFIPPYTGNINELKHPHDDKDPANAPKNKWALFPEPEPEMIPSIYPTNLPPFSKCLDEPLPQPSKMQVNAMKQHAQKFGLAEGSVATAAPKEKNNKKLGKASR